MKCSRVFFFFPLSLVDIKLCTCFCEYVEGLYKLLLISCLQITGSGAFQGPGQHLQTHSKAK